MRAFLRRTLLAIAYIKVNGYILVPRVVRSISEWVPQLTEFHGELGGDALEKVDVELEVETQTVHTTPEDNHRDNHGGNHAGNHTGNHTGNHADNHAGNHTGAVADATNANALGDDASTAQRVSENTDIAATFIE